MIPRKVQSRVHGDCESELTFIEFTYDPDPSDTTIETILFYLIRTPGGLQIELDRHITGLFPRRRWLDLLAEAGFQVEPYPCGQGDAAEPPILLVGTLSDSPK